MSLRHNARVTKAPPCSECPWRRSRVGVHPPELVDQLEALITTDADRVQGCHTNTRRVCGGYLRAVGRKDINVAFAAAFRGVSIAQLTDPEPLFGSVREMVDTYRGAK